MTLNITVRVPNGIVIASDSLASQQMQLGIAPFEHMAKCGSCGTDTKTLVQPPGLLPGFPVNSSPFANKLYYIGEYGIAFHGSAGVGGRTLCNHVLNYAHTEDWRGKQVQDVAGDIAKILHEGLQKDPSFAQLDEKAKPIGFQIAGYNEEDIDLGTTLMVNIGREVSMEMTSEKGAGSTFGGQPEVALRLYRQLHAGDQVSMELLTLPDAVDYARFCIRTTADYQRFAKQVPTVGGPIDIAIITKWAGFRWVERKKLLDDEGEIRLNIGKLAEEVRVLSKTVQNLKS